MKNENYNNGASIVLRMVLYDNEFESILAQEKLVIHTTNHIMLYIKGRVLFMNSESLKYVVLQRQLVLNIEIK